MTSARSKLQIPEMEFMAKAPSIGRLHRAGAKFTMHFDRSSNDPFGELFMKKFTPCLRVSVVNHVCSTSHLELRHLGGSVLRPPAPA